MNSNPSMAQLSSWTDSMTNNTNNGSRGRPPSNNRADPDHKGPSRSQYDEEDLPMNRELRANSSLERFENWTDSMQKSKKATPSKKKDNDDGYEDEEFEDYDEDFEDDEQEAPPKKPVYVEPPAPARQAKVVNNPYNTPSNNHFSSRDEPSAPKPAATRSNHQQPREPEPAESKSARASKFDNMTISLNSMRIADPRVIRAQKLLAANVMELGPAKSTILNILPVSKYDLYMRNLRLANAPVRQIGVPFHLEKRDIDTNTDNVEVAHKSVQFSYGDDTTFYRIMDNIRARRNKSEEKQNDEGPSRSTTNNSTVEVDSTSIGATRLASFLQHASRVCETLLDEQYNNNNNGRSGDSGESKSSTNRRDDSRSQYSLFDAGKDWVTLGKDGTNGGNETVRTRRISCVKFSPLQPHLLVSAHVFPTDESAEMDLKPYKGLYCVWDVGNPGGPQYVLEGSGQPTVCCFSATQSHFVVGGTLEGSLHLWDLREASSIHNDRDAIDLRITKGIRKPTYSTSLPFHSSNSSGLSAQDTFGMGGEEEFQHSAPVVQVESVSAYQGSGHQSAVVSQFVSLDEAGLVIFWVTSQQTTNGGSSGGADNALFGGLEDLQRAPWGSVALVQTRQIHTHSHTLYRGVNGGGHNKHQGGGGAALQGKVGMACIPNDLSTILVSSEEGDVRKVSRIGESPVPSSYHRAEHTLEISASDTQTNANSAGINGTNHKKKGLGTKYFSAVSCLSVRDGEISGGSNNSMSSAEGAAPHGSHAPLMLVGHRDGTVDLFTLDSATPLQSWDLPTFIGTTGGSNGTNGNNRGKADQAGNLYHFDLHVQPHMPLSVESIDVTDKLMVNNIDISHPRVGTGLYYVSAVCSSGKSAECVSVRRGNTQITKVSNVQSDQENAALLQSLHRLSANKLSNTSITYVKESNDDANLQRK
eukprot:gene13283-15302_t